MALTYQGDTTWQQVENPVYGKTAWGLDTVSVKWRGPATGYKAFVDALEQGTVLSEYPKMYLTTWSGDHHHAFPAVTLVYTGLLSGDLPDVLVSDDGGISTASQTDDSAAEPSDQRTHEVVFYSPTRRYRYAAEERVETSQYSDWEGGAVDAPNIIYQRIKDGTGRNRATSGLSWTPVGRLQGIHCNPIEGTPFFECEETWQGVFAEGT